MVNEHKTSLPGAGGGSRDWLQTGRKELWGDGSVLKLNYGTVARL